MLTRRRSSPCGVERKVGNGANELTLGCCTQQRCGHAFAHYVAQQYINASVGMLKEVMEISVNSLGRDAARCDLKTRHFFGRIREQ